MRRRSGLHLLVAVLLAVLTLGAVGVVARGDVVVGFRAGTDTLSGKNYKVEVPRFDIAGVDGPYLQARNEFNGSVRSAAEKYISQVNSHLDLKTSSNYVYTNQRVLSTKMAVSFYAEGAAHPYEEFITHNTSTESGKALALKDLFISVGNGLFVLSQQAQVLVPKTGAGDSYDQSALYASEDNYKNWAVAKDGLRIYFGEIGSHAAGNIMITVPWSALDKVLKPEMKAVLSA